MKREELEHIIRASGDITDQYEFVIVGSLWPPPTVPHLYRRQFLGQYRFSGETVSRPRLAVSTRKIHATDAPIGKVISNSTIA